MSILPSMSMSTTITESVNCTQFGYYSFVCRTVDLMDLLLSILCGNRETIYSQQLESLSLYFPYYTTMPTS